MKNPRIPTKKPFLTSQPNSFTNPPNQLKHKTEYLQIPQDSFERYHTKRLFKPDAITTIETQLTKNRQVLKLKQELKRAFQKEKDDAMDLPSFSAWIRQFLLGSSQKIVQTKISFIKKTDSAAIQTIQNFLDLYYESKDSLVQKENEAKTSMAALQSMRKIRDDWWTKSLYNLDTFKSNMKQVYTSLLLPSPTKNALKDTHSSDRTEAQDAIHPRKKSLFKMLYFLIMKEIA